MCGIFGMIGNVPKNCQSEAYSILRNIFLVSTSRGKDASGFAAIHNEDGAELILDKRPLPAPAFIKRSIKFRTFRKALPTVCIGHTRATTTGTPKRGRNNHPFTNEKYSMVHNGQIKEWKKLIETCGVNVRSETDSEILLRIFERYEKPGDGLQAIIDAINKDSSMAVAFLRYDPKDPRLILFRNEGRPLYIATADKYRTIFFASTEEIIKSALKLSFKGDAAHKIKELGLKYAEIPIFTLIQFGLNKYGNPYTINKCPINKPVIGYTAVRQTVSRSVTKTIGGSKDTKKLVPSTATTSELIKGTDDVTQLKVKRLVDAATESTEIIKSIRTNPYMTRKELDHFKKYRFLV